MSKTKNYSFLKYFNLFAWISKGVGWLSKNQKYWWLFFFFFSTVWMSYDVGRIVTRADLIKMGGNARGVLSLEQATSKAEELKGGRILITSPKTARFVDGNGLAWEISDFGERISKSGYDKFINSGVAVDGGVNINIVPVKTSAKDILATTVLDIGFRLSLLGLYAFIFYMLLKYFNNNKKGRFKSFGESEKPDVRISDVAGHENAKREILEVVDYLKDPSSYSALGARPPRGILMYGPPGNGKTLLAKAIAGEAKAHFIEQSASSFIEVYAGEGAKSVRKLFEEARKNLPCVIFIDEIDAIGEARGSANQIGEHRQTLLALLVEMDGFTSNDNLVVIAATNQIHVLDEALIRPKRFDRKVYIPLPNKHDRLEILKAHALKLPHINVDLESWAAKTPGFSGASLASLVNEAAIEAARSKKTVVTDEDFALAKDRVLLGVKDSTRQVSEKERKIVGYHEIGHALLRLNIGGTVEKISIEPRGMALGVTVSGVNEEHVNLYTEQEIRNEILVMMGGRAAEEVFCKTVTTGSSDDMEKASELARKAISTYGFGQNSPYVSKSPHVLKEIEEKASMWIQEEYKRAIEIISTKQEVVEKLIVKLLDENEISGSDLESLK